MAVAQLLHQYQASNPSPLLVDSNILEHWKMFNQKWRIYSIIVKRERYPGEYQIAVILSTLGDAALRVHNGLKYDTPEEECTVEEIITAFDLFCIGEVNETYKHRRNF